MKTNANNLIRPKRIQYSTFNFLHSTLSGQRPAPSCRRQFIPHRRTSGRTCIVSDSGGHQSASGGSAGGSASGTPAHDGWHRSLRARWLTSQTPLNTPSPPLNQQLTSPSRIPCPSSRRRYCSSYTFSTGKRLGACTPLYAKRTQFSEDRPNHNSCNDNELQRKKPLVNAKKNEPKTHQKRTKNEQKRIKTSQFQPKNNPPKNNPHQTQFQKGQISLEAIHNFYTIPLPAAKSRRTLYENVQITGETKC